MAFWKRHYVLTLSLLLVAVFLVSLFVGRYGMSPAEIGSLVLEKLGVGDFANANAAHTAFFVIRVPRNVGAVLVGAGLACAGAVFQGVFKNPMSSPDILGAATGAGFGAACGILLSLSAVAVQLFSFAGGLAAVLLTCGIARSIEGKGATPVTLVLTGIVVSGIFQAGISLTKYVADPNSTLPSITLWLMGTFSSLTWADVGQLATLLTVSVLPMFLFRWRLSVLAMGDEEAKTLGVNVPLVRMVLIVCATLVTSTAVAYCGVIGWIGLVVPHMARSIVGADCTRLIPASLLLGGSFSLAVDIVARSLLPIELPLGILTALIGAPFFLFLLKRSRGGWSR
ncbi:iron ABC transporter permease [Gordonibacter sp. 28C]|uniref:FecCD family ABC transporter permease n=1 Tax=Gordonibacter sp. 28C TaxID=2078569 RepID=UPI000DF79BF2|nr:iron ABC transporter permease [Gordonibacter sp. 28C]RDB64669.1 iron ABC transporter permease [Gordonibacter sp. 28C]